jgi:ParB/RepB/Spo0J family partition protein
MKIPINRIVLHPKLPRIELDKEKLENLSKSIKDDGLLHPIIVRRRGDAYELLAGKRRYLAAKQAGSEAIEVNVINADDKKARRISFVENYFRENISERDEAEAIKAYMEDFHLTEAEFGKNFDKSQSNVSQTLSFLRLSPNIPCGIIDRSALESIARIKQFETQEKLAEMYQKKFLQSNREVEKSVKSYKFIEAAATAVPSEKRDEFLKLARDEWEKNPDKPEYISKFTTSLMESFTPNKKTSDISKFLKDFVIDDEIKFSSPILSNRIEIPKSNFLAEQEVKFYNPVVLFPDVAWDSEPFRTIYRKPKFGIQFIPFLPENMIRIYTSIGDVVLDQMVGSGTTVLCAALMKRHSIGFDSDEGAVRIAKNRIQNHPFISKEYFPEIHQGDACSLKLKNGTIDFALFSPIYEEKTYGIIEHVLKETYRVLKPGKFCAVVVGDFRIDGTVSPLHSKIITSALKLGFRVHDIKVHTTVFSRTKSRLRGNLTSAAIKNKHSVTLPELIIVLQKDGGSEKR